MTVPEARFTLFSARLHLQPAAQDLGYERGSFPVCEDLADMFLSLSVHSHMTDDEAAEVIRGVREFCLEKTG